MKDIDSIRRSKTRANVGTLESFSFGSSSDRCNGTRNSSIDKRVNSDSRRSNPGKAIMGGSNSKKRRVANHSASPLSTSRSNPTKRSLKQSPEMRPRRRASQTYFFKYQLAKNPLKAEEEDLKLALLASLQQCQEQNIKPQSPAESDQATITSGSSISPEVIDSKPATPDNVLQQYRPETEEFLTFICFRATAPNYQNVSKLESQDGTPDDTNSAMSEKTDSNNIGNDANSRSQANSTADCHGLKSCTNDANNLKLSSNKLTGNRTGSPVANDINHRNQSPNSNRRPIRQSPRLASSIQKKISENESSNQTTSVTNTAYDLPINYEEDLERASIALEDMAHEINSSDGPNNANNNYNNDDDNNNFAQDSPECISKLSSSSYKNNRHLIKGLMTREFAGAFADEETIFESISNHKL